MKRKVTITEKEWKSSKWSEGGEMQEVNINNKPIWAWKVGNVFITKYEHDYVKKNYTIEYTEQEK